MFRKIILIALVAVCLTAIFLIAMSFTNEQAHSRIHRFLNHPDYSLSSSTDMNIPDDNCTDALQLFVSSV